MRTSVQNIAFLFAAHTEQTPPAARVTPARNLVKTRQPNRARNKKGNSRGKKERRIGISYRFRECGCTRRPGRLSFIFAPLTRVTHVTLSSVPGCNRADVIAARVVLTAI